MHYFWSILFLFLSANNRTVDILKKEDFNILNLMIDNFHKAHSDERKCKKTELRRYLEPNLR